MKGDFHVRFRGNAGVKLPCVTRLAVIILNLHPNIKPIINPYKKRKMAKHKTEVTLKGEFTTIDVFLEGIEIPLREINDNEYYKLYSEFEIQNPLDIQVRLKGWIGMKWGFSIILDDKEVYSNKGTFDYKGFVTFTVQKNI
jgi:hypothetical protein